MLTLFDCSRHSWGAALESCPITLRTSLSSKEWSILKLPDKVCCQNLRGLFKALIVNPINVFKELRMLYIIRISYCMVAMCSVIILICFSIKGNFRIFIFSAKLKAWTGEGGGEDVIKYIWITLSFAYI